MANASVISASSDDDSFSTFVSALMGSLGSIGSNEDKSSCLSGSVTENTEKKQVPEACGNVHSTLKCNGTDTCGRELADIPSKCSINTGKESSSDTGEVPSSLGCNGMNAYSSDIPRKCSRNTVEDSSSDDDHLEDFLNKMKTPLRQRIAQQLPKCDMKDFIVSDDEDVGDDVSSDDVSDGHGDEVFYLTTTPKLTTPLMRKPILPWSCNDGPFTEGKAHRFKTPYEKTASFYTIQKPRGRHAIAGDTATRTKDSTDDEPLRVRLFQDKIGEIGDNIAFVNSLHSSSQSRFVRQFSRNKVELTKKLYSIYNSEIFSEKLPANLDIQWNARLVKTAGQCVYKSTGSGENLVRAAYVQLSTKVCDNAEWTLWSKSITEAPTNESSSAIVLLSRMTDFFYNVRVNNVVILGWLRLCY